jgi:hypothetical protein
MFVSRGSGIHDNVSFKVRKGLQLFDVNYVQSHDHNSHVDLTSPHLTVPPLLISDLFIPHSLQPIVHINTQPSTRTSLFAAHSRHPTTPNATTNPVTCQRSRRTLESQAFKNFLLPRNFCLAVSQLPLTFPPRGQLAATQKQLCTTPQPTSQQPERPTAYSKQPCLSPRSRWSTSHLL